jgi:hypothetical protein
MPITPCCWVVHGYKMPRSHIIREITLEALKVNGIVHTITVTKHLDSNTKRPEVSFCDNFVNGITNEEENVILMAKLDLFAISIIILLELEVLVVMSDAKSNTDAKNGIDVEIDMDPKILLIPKLILI